MSKPLPPWRECRTIELDLDRPPAERYRAVPAEVVRAGRRLLEAIRPEIPRSALHLAHLVRLRTAGRFHAELRAMADSAGADWRELAVANVSYDLRLNGLGCSTVALPTAEGPVVARNMDWVPEGPLARASYCFRCVRGGRHAFTIAGFPGSAGVVTGLSARGFALVLNAVLCDEGGGWRGYPVMLHLRRVLEDAPDFDAAVEMLSRPTLAAPCLVTVAGTDNAQRVVVERSPTRFALRWGQQGRPLVTTNDYRLLYPTPEQFRYDDNMRLYKTACTRYDRLLRLSSESSAGETVADDRLLYWLTDPAIFSDITAQHIILRPRPGTVRMFVPRRLLD
jgi:hypothetical protein